MQPDSSFCGTTDPKQGFTAALDKGKPKEIPVSPPLTASLRHYVGLGMLPTTISRLLLPETICTNSSTQRYQSVKLANVFTGADSGQKVGNGA